MGLYEKAWAGACRVRGLIRLAPVLLASYLLGPSVGAVLEDVPLTAGLPIAGAGTLLGPLLIVALGAASPTLLAVLIVLASALPEGGIMGVQLPHVSPDLGAGLAVLLIALDGAAQRCLSIQPRAGRSECRTAACIPLGVLVELLLLAGIAAIALNLAQLPWWAWRLLVSVGRVLPPDTAPAWESFARTPLVGLVVLGSVLAIEAWFMLVVGGWLRVILAGGPVDAARLLDRLRRLARERIDRASEWYHEAYRSVALILVGAPLELGWAVVLGKRHITAGGLLGYTIISTIVYLLVMRRLLRRLPKLDDLSIYKLALVILVFSALPILLSGAEIPRDLPWEMLRAVRGLPPGASPDVEPPLVERLGRLLEAALRVLFAS